MSKKRVYMYLFLVLILTVIFAVTWTYYVKYNTIVEPPMRENPYPPDKAKEAGDVVNVHGRFTNLEKFTAFLEHVDKHKPDQIKITSYTIEGDPVFDELDYDGQTIKHRYDNSMDHYAGTGNAKENTATCQGIVAREAEQGKEYFLTGCDGEREERFFFFIPNETRR
ncbi:DUF4362 domain-containing protein [Brevibacillus dissolubilis]|uniref:DUF4362 domain-containing protein n=1 Tax=Brevibacillus dissolubilis TaxID=1844116 RepID=UPI001115CCA3|nr:DUF4362 domain-containing protein [Brevibacillus dissolubilis]